MIKAVIVDDIESIRLRHKELVEKHCSDVKIVGEADSVNTAIDVIKQTSPDLVFLDVEIEGGTGFDVLKQLTPFTFKVVFITGFQEYAVNAFRFSAIDYLIKPISAACLTEAVKKATQAISKEQLETKLQALFLNIERPNHLQKLVLKTADSIYSVNIQDIIRCQSDKNYTWFYFIDNKKILVSNTMKDYEDLLLAQGFLRIHKSHLINIAYFDRYIKKEGGYIIMKDDTELPISPSKKDELFQKIGISI